MTAFASPSQGTGTEDGNNSGERDALQTIARLRAELHKLKKQNDVPTPEEEPRTKKTKRKRLPELKSSTSSSDSVQRKKEKKKHKKHKKEKRKSTKHSKSKKAKDKPGPRIWSPSHYDNEEATVSPASPSGVEDEMRWWSDEVHNSPHGTGSNNSWVSPSRSVSPRTGGNGVNNRWTEDDDYDKMYGDDEPAPLNPNCFPLCCQLPNPDTIAIARLRLPTDVVYRSVPFTNQYVPPDPTEPTLNPHQRGSISPSIDPHATPRQSLPILATPEEAPERWLTNRQRERERVMQQVREREAELEQQRQIQEAQRKREIEREQERRRKEAIELAKKQQEREKMQKVVGDDGYHRHVAEYDSDEEAIAQKVLQEMQQEREEAERAKQAELRAARGESSSDGEGTPDFVTGMLEVDRVKTPPPTKTTPQTTPMVIEDDGQVTPERGITERDPEHNTPGTPPLTPHSPPTYPQHGQPGDFATRYGHTGSYGPQWSQPRNNTFQRGGGNFRGAGRKQWSGRPHSQLKQPGRPRQFTGSNWSGGGY